MKAVRETPSKIKLFSMKQIKDENCKFFKKSEVFIPNTFAKQNMWK